MNPELFTANCNGTIVATEHGNPAFVPRPLPPAHAWDHGLISAVTRAAEAVAVLARAAQDVASPLLVNNISQIFANKEAQFSSQIEGIHTTTMDLLLAEEGESNFQRENNGNQSTEASKEVLNYLRALRMGLARIKDPRDLPLCLRLIRDLHKELLSGVRGQERQPGVFRARQNAIGRPGDSEAEAAYVPPPPHEMEQLLHQLEEFLQADSSRQISIYLRCAYVHYQFEAIHPFMDGNGRIGRLLIILMLCESDTILQPLIYPSAHFDANRQQYYDCLMRVSTVGDWRSWLMFFLDGVAVQAGNALQRLGRLHALHRDYTAVLQDVNAPGKMLRLVDRLFSNPLVNSTQIEKQLAVGSSTAHRYLEQLMRIGLLIDAFPERKRNKLYLASEILNCIDDD